jgi:hypothetical protein
MHGNPTDQEPLAPELEDEVCDGWIHHPLVIGELGSHPNVSTIGGYGKSKMSSKGRVRSGIGRR